MLRKVKGHLVMGHNDNDTNKGTHKAPSRFVIHLLLSEAVRREKEKGGCPAPGRAGRCLLLLL